MDADELLARQLQEEEDRAVAQLHSLKGRGGEQAFQARLQSGVQTVLTYEDETLQAMALSVIPEDELQAAAEQAIAESKAKGEEPVLAQQDALARQLLLWFKRDFFKWVNNPPCSGCSNSETVPAGMGRPSEDDTAAGAGRVELYNCPGCGTQTRFPRYNNPGRLLQSRRGRCGEWANCFALCCRAIGLDTRYILDLTDHVWVEYFSAALSRWIHMDPCEAAYDQPLLYEAGWGKKLTYVVAFSKEGVRDVTQRYTKNWNELLLRRQEVSEPWLMSACFALTVRLRSQLDLSDRSLLKQRDIMEDQEFSLAPPPPPSQEQVVLPGRQTGSVEWRAARGELGRAAARASPAVAHTPKGAQSKLAIERGGSNAVGLETQSTDGAVTKSGAVGAWPEALSAPAAAAGGAASQLPAAPRKAGSFTAAASSSCNEAGSQQHSEVSNSSALESSRAPLGRLSVSHPPAEVGDRPAPRGDHSAAQEVLAARVRKEFARLMAAGSLSPNEAAAAALRAATGS